MFSLRVSIQILSSYQDFRLLILFVQARWWRYLSGSRRYDQILLLLFEFGLRKRSCTKARGLDRFDSRLNFDAAVEVLHKCLSLARLCSCSKRHLSSQLTSRSKCSHLPHRAIQAISLAVLYLNLGVLLNHWSTHFYRMQRYQRIVRLLVAMIKALQMFDHNLWKVSFLTFFVLWRSKKTCTFDTLTTLALLFLCNFLLWIHIKLLFSLFFQTRLFIFFFW